MDSYTHKSLECKWVFNIGKISKFDIVRDVTSYTIKRVGLMLPFYNYCSNWCGTCLMGLMFSGDENTRGITF